MSRKSSPTLMVALSLLVAGSALAQSNPSGGQATGNAAGDANPSTNGAKVHSSAEASAGVNANADADKWMQAVEAKGEKVSASALKKADAKLEAAAKKVDEEATAKGDSKVAGHLGAEFGMTAEAITDEKSRLDVSWGELTIARTLIANTKSRTAVEPLIEMRKDHVGWAQIAAGMGLKLGEVTSAVQTESRVAQGLAKADGKVAVIHGDGSRAGLGANAGLNGAVSTDHTRAGVAAGAGLGVNIGH